MGKHLSDNFPIQNGPKQGDALSLLLFNFALESVIRRVQETQVGPKLTGTHQLLVYAHHVNLLADNTVKHDLRRAFIKRNFVLNGNIFRLCNYHSIP
jgi:hypothetical protein